MTKITFNSKSHQMFITIDGETTSYNDVMTIKNNEGFYEILQRQQNESVAPLYRLPLNSTIIEYQHNV